MRSSARSRGSVSIQSATRRWTSARAARDIWPYAPSRTSAWTNDVLLRAGDRRAMLPPHELLALERVQALLELPRLDVGEARQRIGPEHLPEHGRELEELLLLAGKSVDPRGDDSLQGLGSGGRRSLPSASMRAYSSANSGLPSARCEERRLLLGRRGPAFRADAASESRGVLVRRAARARPSPRCASPRPSPAGARAARAAPSRRRAAGRRSPGRRARRRSRAARRRPSGVLEDEHDGLLLRERLEEPPPGGEGLVEARRPADASPAGRRSASSR